jgi:hypothetical protein
MVYPGPPPAPEEPRRHRPEEHGQREDWDDHDDLDIRIRRPPRDDDLTTVDWLLCIFCSGIACIVGIVRLIQGKPSAGKMIAVALVFSVLWGIVRFLLEAALRRQ